MGHRDELTEQASTGLERARTHDSPRLGVVFRRPVRGATQSGPRVSQLVGKVIFGRGDGAVSGMQGVAAVGVRVEGLSIGDDEAQIVGGLGGDGAAKENVGGGLALTDLRFQGSVRVGRKGLG
jgi:hypothetical protein